MEAEQHTIDLPCRESNGFSFNKLKYNLVYVLNTSINVFCTSVYIRFCKGFVVPLLLLLFSPYYGIWRSDPRTSAIN